jgi:hypothetical protein
MTEESDNPWVERFHPLFDVNEIKRRAIFRSPTLRGLRDLPRESASHLLREALEPTFYPNSQCIAILKRWVGIAYAHSQVNYFSREEHFGRLHDEDIEFRRGTVPMCLTGLAGVGKSALIKAAARVMPPTERITSKDNMLVSLKSFQSLKIEVSSSPNDLLHKFSGSGGSGDQLKKNCRRFAFQNGISFMFADEFQFAALSSEANTQITKMLLSLDTLGIPFVYTANFSMLHKLKKRNEQELQRLATDITEFMPDPSGSDDWKETLVLLQGVAPDVIVFDPAKDAVTIHALCGGIKRALVSLLDIAYSSAHGVGAVGVDELVKAYRSRNYASYRENMAALHQMTTEVRRKRVDLWNPFRPVDEIVEMEQRNFEQRQALVANASMLAAMTPEERKDSAKSARQPTATTEGVRNRGGKRSPPTADELTRNMLLFRDGLRST